MAKKTVTLDEFKKYMKSGFLKDMKTPLASLEAPMNYLPADITSRKNMSRGKLLSGYIDGFASKIIEDKFANVHPIGKKTDGHGHLTLDDNGKKYFICLHYSDENVSSMNIGSPDVILSDIESGACEDYIHVFMNGFDNGINEIAVKNLDDLIKKNLVHYPKSNKSNQLQFTKTASLADLISDSNEFAYKGRKARCSAIERLLDSDN